MHLIAPWVDECVIELHGNSIFLYSFVPVLPVLENVNLTFHVFFFSNNELLKCLKVWFYFLTQA